MAWPFGSTRRADSPRASRTSARAGSVPAPRRLSHLAEEERRQRLLIIGGAVLLVIVLGIVAGGWIIDNVVDARNTAAVVYEQTITTQDVVNTLQPIVAAEEKAQQKQGVSAPATNPQFQQQVQSLPDQVLNQLIEKIIVQHEADLRGISVPADQVDQALREDVAQYQAATSPQPTPAPDATDSPTPASPGAADQPTSAGTTPTPVPTLPEDQYQTALSALLAQAGLSQQEALDEVRTNLLEQQITDQMGADIPSSQPQIHAQHIVVADQQTAQSLLQQLQAGADFATLAQQSSTDTSTKDAGGDLGWLPKGIEGTQFDNAAFSLQPGQLSDVVSTTNGYEIIQVLETDADRPVAPDLLARLKQDAFQTWLSDEQTGSNVQKNFDVSERTWVIQHVGIRPT